MAGSRLTDSDRVIRINPQTDPDSRSEGSKTQYYNIITPSLGTFLATLDRTMPKTQIKFPDLPLPQPSGSKILARERAKATFDSNELARYIHGDEYLERQARLLKILESEPLFSKSDVYYQGRDEKFRASMAKAKRMIQVDAFTRGIRLPAYFNRSPRKRIGKRTI